MLHLSQRMSQNILESFRREQRRGWWWRREPGPQGTGRFPRHAAKEECPRRIGVYCLTHWCPEGAHPGEASEEGSGLLAADKLGRI